MITPEQWLLDMEARRNTREYFAGQSGQLFLQLLYRSSSAPVSIQSGHTPEMELGRVRGYAECLRVIEGIAFQAEQQPDQATQEFLNEDD